MASVRLTVPWELNMSHFGLILLKTLQIFDRHLFANPLRYCQAIGQIWSNGQVWTCTGSFGSFPVYFLHSGQIFEWICENVPAIKGLVSGSFFRPKTLQVASIKTRSANVAFFFSLLMISFHQVSIVCAGPFWLEIL